MVTFGQIIIRSDQDTVEHIEYHHFYGPNREDLFSPIWYYQQPSVLLLPNVAQKQVQHEVLSETWPEGSFQTFVKEDLRRVYGTYPSPAVSISYQNGEFLVRGNPRVGEQEYRVEKLVRKERTLSNGDRVGEVVKKKQKIGKKVI